ncbi:hypothetical protein BaRGS_00034883 [Batillaria attramentaria]|uniref:Uncharacterized protein n=1 Tax=Batillaria attramentaria TaxID=370345 RepID=A0ABD0JGG8_9CAEN
MDTVLGADVLVVAPAMDRPVGAVGDCVGGAVVVVTPAIDTMTVVGGLVVTPAKDTPVGPTVGGCVVGPVVLAKETPVGTGGVGPWVVLLLAMETGPTVAELAHVEQHWYCVSWVLPDEHTLGEQVTVGSSPWGHVAVTGTTKRTVVKENT